MYDDLTTLGEVIQHGILPTGERHPIVRRGEREVIPPHVRAAVWYRDRGRCQICRTIPNGPWHLDHVTPWSAGGADTSDNLRVLCERHNLERGNTVDPTERPQRPATWWCQRCYALSGFAWKYDAEGVPTACPWHRINLLGETQCRVINGYRRHRRLTGEWPTWHRRPPLESFHGDAYCAHCRLPGLTGVVL